jgi:hypothetical protein
MWRWRGNHVALTWLPRGAGVAATWCSRCSHMALTWLPRGWQMTSAYAIFPKLNFSLYKSITAQPTYIPSTTHIHFSPTNAQQIQNRYINPKNRQITIYFTILTEITRISTDQQITYIFYLASPPTVWHHKHYL